MKNVAIVLTDFGLIIPGVFSIAKWVTLANCFSSRDSRAMKCGKDDEEVPRSEHGRRNKAEEVAVGERIAYWICTPQVPGSRPG